MSEPLTDEHVRALLLAPHPAAPREVDLEHVIRGGRRLRRRSQLGRTTGTLVAAALVVYASSVLHHRAALDRASEVLPGATPASTAASSPAGTQASSNPNPSGSAPRQPPGPSPVLTVHPGQHIAIDAATDLWLTATGKCQTIAGSAPAATSGECHSATDGNQGAGSVSLQGLSGVGQHALYSGIYTGRGAATITVTDGVTGRVYLATIVALAGRPSWVAYFAVGGTERQTGDATTTLGSTHDRVLVLDDHGRVLAHLP
jgi:hypothetical protein